LVRTNKADKYHGISFMLYDMKSEGVTTKPILLISGSSPFCETFFDDVNVPKEYAPGVSSVVGEVNRGWDVAKYLLGHEREMISNMGGDGGTASLGAGFKDVMETAPVLRAQMALFDVDSLAFRSHSERFMDEWKTGKAHPAYSNLMKYQGTELNKKRHELVMAMGGSDALEWESEGSRGGKRARDWLRTKGNSIEGGTSEVMLNVVSKRILEMPGA
jgi:alkylation response protein AidB-like acyl-CoA dehydrogenase